MGYLSCACFAILNILEHLSFISRLFSLHFDFSKIALFCMCRHGFLNKYSHCWADVSIFISIKFWIIPNDILTQVIHQNKTHIGEQRKNDYINITSNPKDLSGISAQDYFRQMLCELRKQPKTLNNSLQFTNGLKQLQCWFSKWIKMCQKLTKFIIETVKSAQQNE